LKALNLNTMAKKFLIITLCLFAGLAGYPQGVLKITNDKYDFGLVDEGTQAVHEFEFENTGNAPIVLTDVRASCGCTTPSWTKDPVAPGAKGTIKASYNSEGRPGNFVKSITVTSNATEASKVLYIKGIVDPKKEKPTYTAEQLKASPKANFDKTSFNFAKVERGQKVTSKTTIKNSGKSPLTINAVQSACNCITHKLDKESIPAGKTAVLELTYSPVYDGKNTDIAVIQTNDLHNGKTQITFNSEVVESLTTKSPVIQEKSAVPFSK
jgi:hypothetical protein